MFFLYTAIEYSTHFVKCGKEIKRRRTNICKIINSILYQNREKLNLVIKDHKWAIFFRIFRILIKGMIIPNVEVPKTVLFVN